MLLTPIFFFLFFCQKPNFCFTMPGLRKTDSALPLLRCQTTSFLSISNSYYSQIILDFPLQRQSLSAAQSFPLFPCVAIYKYDDEFGIKGMWVIPKDIIWSQNTFIYLAENRLKSAKVRWFLESIVNFDLGQVTQISCNESGKNLS